MLFSFITKKKLNKKFIFEAMFCCLMHSSCVVDSEMKIDKKNVSFFLNSKGKNLNKQNGHLLSSGRA